MLDVFHSGIPFAFCMVHRPPNTNLLFIYQDEPDEFGTFINNSYNSDFRNKLNFKIKTNLILNVFLIAPINSRPYQEKL